MEKSCTHTHGGVGLTASAESLGLGCFIRTPALFVLLSQISNLRKAHACVHPLSSAKEGGRDSLCLEKSVFYGPFFGHFSYY